MKNYGFTLIELLVVVSIIGMLSSITLASLSSAKDRAIDSKTTQTFVTIRNQAEISRSDYSFFCSNQTIVDAVASIDAECRISGSAWAIYAHLEKPPAGKTGYCLDSTGLQNYINYSSFCGVSCFAGGACMP